jgi:hypothetical protein
MACYRLVRTIEKEEGYSFVVLLSLPEREAFHPVELVKVFRFDDVDVFGDGFAQQVGDVDFIRVCSEGIS